MKNLMIFLTLVSLFFLLMPYILPSHIRPYSFLLDPISDRLNYVTHKVKGTDELELPSSIYKQPI